MTLPKDIHLAGEARIGPALVKFPGMRGRFEVFNIHFAFQFRNSEQSIKDAVKQQVKAGHTSLNTNRTKANTNDTE